MDAPTSPSRIHALDALRGFALAGITLAHMIEQFIAAPRPPAEIWGVTPTLLDQVIQGLNFLLISGKFFSIFSLLFGISFAIMMTNAERRGQAFRGRFIWRLVLLAGLGLLHALFYRGDILTVYALIGLSLPLFYQLSNRVLWVLALLLFVGAGRVIFLLLTGTDTLLSFSWNLPDSPVVVEYIQTLREGTPMDVFALNLTQGMATKWDFQLAVGGRGYLTLAYFLMGIILVRSGLVGHIAQRGANLKKLFWSSLGAAVVFLLLTIGSFATLAEPIDMTRWNFVLGMVCYDLLGVALTLMLISGFLWRYLHKPEGKLGKFSAYGRMALTHYLLQTLVGTFIFYGWGLGLLGKLHDWQTLLLALVLVYLQIQLSLWWLSRYRYGPLEWVWRCGTYLKWVPLKQA